MSQDVSHDAPQPSPPISVLIPVYNDWAALTLLLRGLDRVAAESHRFKVVVVDDGSTADGEAYFRSECRALSEIAVLRLRRNLGRQRAISVGIVHAYNAHPEHLTVIMDGPGEDRTEDIPAPISKCQRESGKKIIVPYSCLSTLVVSEIWNHNAAAVFNARLPYDSIAAPRRVRLQDRSGMNFVAFVAHGLRATSVYSEKVGTRLLLLSSIINSLLIAAIAVTVFIRLHGSLAVADWATNAAGQLLVLLLQVCAMSFAFIFVVLNGRSNTSFIPIRDCPYFVEQITRVWPSAEVGA